MTKTAVTRLWEFCLDLRILHTGFMLLILELTVPNGLVLQWERMLNEDSDE